MQSNPKETKQPLTHSTEEQGGKNAELLKRDLQLLQRDKQPQSDSLTTTTTQITQNYFRVTSYKNQNEHRETQNHRSQKDIILLLY